MEVMGPEERRRSRIIPTAAFPSASRKMNENLQSQLPHLDTALKRIKEGVFFPLVPAHLPGAHRFPSPKAARGAGDWVPLRSIHWTSFPQKTL